MKQDRIARFQKLWKKYFGDSELPLAFFFSDREGDTAPVRAPSGHRCVMADIRRARKGTPLRFHIGSLGCGGARRYFGFSDEISEDFDYFLSCGIPGKLEGERYKKTPGHVRELTANAPRFTTPSKYILFKRWDQLLPGDEPEAVIFFAPPDVLSGLFTLANFDERDRFGVVAPFAAGCGSIVLYPFMEQRSDRPRSVLGMFDVSARPFVEGRVLSFAVPMRKFATMIDDMDESFLITSSWKKVRRRLGA